MDGLKTGRFHSMLAYVNAAIIFWINIQRECDALPNACIAIDESLSLFVEPRRQGSEIDS